MNGAELKDLIARTIPAHPSNFDRYLQQLAQLVPDGASASNLLVAQDSGSLLTPDQLTVLAYLLPSVADANAQCVALALPAPDGAKVPVILVGRAGVENVDLGLFHGSTEPTLALLNAAADRCFYTRYVAGAWRTATTAAVQWAFDCSVFLNATAVLGPNIDLQFGFGQGNLRTNTIGDDDLRLGLGGTNLFLVGPDSQRATSFGKGMRAHPTVMGTSNTAYATATDQWWSHHHDGSHARHSTGKGEIRHTSEEHFNAATGLGWSSALLSGLSGTEAIAAGLFPPGVNQLGVSSRVVTEIDTGGGASGYQVGDGSDDDRYGLMAAVVVGTTSDHNNFTADPRGWSASAQDVVVKPNSGTFSGGAVRVVSHWQAVSPPTS